MVEAELKLLTYSELLQSCNRIMLQKTAYNSRLCCSCIVVHFHKKTKTGMIKDKNNTQKQECIKDGRFGDLRTTFHSYICALLHSTATVIHTCALLHSTATVIHICAYGLVTAKSPPILNTLLFLYFSPPISNALLFFGFFSPLISTTYM